MTGRLFVLGAMLLAAAAGIRASAVHEAVPLRAPLEAMPDALAGWRSAGDLPLDEGTVQVLRADDYLDRVYTREGATAELFVGYYATQRQGDTMHSPMNCLPAAGWQPVSMGRADITTPAGNSIHANRYLIQKGLDQRLVFYWYQSHGRTVASEYASKAYLVLDSLRLHRSDAALVRVISPLGRNPGATERLTRGFVGALGPVLDRFIPR